MSKSRRNSQKGFTIVELLIATAVLSFILLLVTLVATSIGSLYSKGVNLARVQDDVRSVSDELAKELELNNGGLIICNTVSTCQAGANGYADSVCVGDARYSYIFYQEIGTTTKHVLWRDAVTPGSCPQIPLNTFKNMSSPTAGGTELISADSRLTDFNVSPTSPYSVSLGIAYGADDLLCNNTISGDCTTGGVSTGIKALLTSGGLVRKVIPNDIVCKGLGAGDQYCATSFLQTVVAERVN